MESLSYRLFSLVVVTVAIVAVQFIAKRFVEMRWPGPSGIYIMLLPVGFNCFGWGLPSILVAIWVVGGLFVLLWGIRNSYKLTETV